MKKKQHWKSKCSSGYAIGLGKVSMWKLHWFGGSELLYANLLVVSLLVNDMIDHIYKKIFAISGVSRMRFKSTHIEIRPQIVGDIDVVWPLREYAASFCEPMLWWFYETKFKKLASKYYFYSARHYGINMGIFKSDKLRLVSKLSYFDNLMYRCLGVNFISRGVSLSGAFNYFCIFSYQGESVKDKSLVSTFLIREELHMLHFFRYRVSRGRSIFIFNNKIFFRLFKRYFGIPDISILCNFILLDYIFGKNVFFLYKANVFHLLRCAAYVSVFHLYNDAFEDVEDLLYKVEEKKNNLAYMDEWFMHHENYTYECYAHEYMFDFEYLDYLVVDLLLVSYFNFISILKNLFFSVVCSSPVGRLVSLKNNVVSFDSLINGFARVRNYLFSATISKPERVTKDEIVISHCSYIDYFFYYVFKVFDMFNYIICKYNVNSGGRLYKGFLKNQSSILRHFRRISLLFYFYSFPLGKSLNYIYPYSLDFSTTRIMFRSENELLDRKHRLSYRNFDNKIYSRWRHKEFRRVRVQRNTLEHKQHVLWDSFEDFVSYSYKKILFLTVFLYDNYKMIESFYFIKRCDDADISRFNIWSVVVWNFCQNYSFFYKLYLSNSIALCSFRNFRVWTFSRIECLKHFLFIYGRLLGRVNFYPTLNRRFILPEPNNQAKIYGRIFLSFASHGILSYLSAQVFTQRNSLTLVKGMFSRLYGRLSGTLFVQYRKFIFDMEYVGRWFDKYYFTDMLFSPFVMFRVYRVLMRYYNDKQRYLLKLNFLLSKVFKLMKGLRFIFIFIIKNSNRLLVDSFVYLMKKLRNLSYLIINYKYSIYLLLTYLCVFDVTNMIMAYSKKLRWLVLSLNSVRDLFMSIGIMSSKYYNESKENLLYRLLVIGLYAFRELIIRLSGGVFYCKGIISLFGSVHCFRKFLFTVYIWIWRLRDRKRITAELYNYIWSELLLRIHSSVSHLFVSNGFYNQVHQISNIRLYSSYFYRREYNYLDNKTVVGMVINHYRSYLPFSSIGVSMLEVLISRWLFIFKSYAYYCVQHSFSDVSNLFSYLFYSKRYLFFCRYFLRSFSQYILIFARRFFSGSSFRIFTNFLRTRYHLMSLVRLHIKRLLYNVILAKLMIRNYIMCAKIYSYIRGFKLELCWENPTIRLSYWRYLPFYTYNGLSYFNCFYKSMDYGFFFSTYERKGFRFRYSYLFTRKYIKDVAGSFGWLCMHLMKWRSYVTNWLDDCAILFRGFFNKYVYYRNLYYNNLFGIFLNKRILRYKFISDEGYYKKNYYGCKFFIYKKKIRYFSKQVIKRSNLNVYSYVRALYSLHFYRLLFGKEWSETIRDRIKKRNETYRYRAMIEKHRAQVKEVMRELLMFLKLPRNELLSVYLYWQVLIIRYYREKLSGIFFNRDSNDASFSNKSTISQNINYVVLLHFYYKDFFTYLVSITEYVKRYRNVYYIFGYIPPAFASLFSFSLYNCVEIVFHNYNTMCEYIMVVGFFLLFKFVRVFIYTECTDIFYKLVGIREVAQMLSISNTRSLLIDVLSSDFTNFSHIELWFFFKDLDPFIHMMLCLHILYIVMFGAGIGKYWKFFFFRIYRLLYSAIFDSVLFSIYVCSVGFFFYICSLLRLLFYCSINPKLLVNLCYSYLHMLSVVYGQSNSIDSLVCKSASNDRYILYNNVYMLNYLLRRSSILSRYNNADINYTHNLLMWRLFRIYRNFFKYGDIYYRRVPSDFNNALCTLFSFLNMGNSKLFKSENVKIFPIRHNWRDTLYVEWLELRRQQKLGKYKYDTMPLQRRFSWLFVLFYSLLDREYWYNRAVYEQALVGRRQEFLDMFILFRRYNLPLVIEDFLLFYFFFLFHKWILYYFVRFFGVYNRDIFYMPDIYLNEDYEEPPIIDSDFICRYIKVTILKRDTLYECISEVKVWIFRSLHRGMGYTYFYRMNSRMSHCKYRTSELVPLIRAIKLEVSGRVNERRRTVVKMYRFGGRVSTARLHNRPIIYTSTQGQSKYGVYGLKCWVFFHYQTTRGLIHI